MCEEEIKKVTASVFKYILPDTCSDAEKEEKSITAEMVVEAIKYGKKVEIINAVIVGPFILKSVNVEGEVTIKNTTIRGHIDWSYATFKRVLNLKNSIFETDATFTAVTVDKDIFLDGATFCEKAVFADISVMGAFYSQSTTFKKDVIFSDGIVKKRITFNKSTFVGEANFRRARIGSDAEFTGAVFKERANFNSTQIDGDAYFNPYLFNIDVEFEEELNKGLISEKLKNMFKTEGFSISQKAIVTKDKGDNWVIADEEKNHIVKKEDGKLNIYNPATFVGEADFESARIGSNAEFLEAKFNKKASFNSTKIDGVAFFKLATFMGDADFISARIGSNAEFMGVKFGGDTDFVSARIGGVAEFMGAEFEQLASFNRAQIEESAFFKSATFMGDADFISARIGSNAEFMGAEFKQLATFNSAQIDGAAFFKPAYLFVIDVKFKDDLNKGIISEKLKNIFETEDYSLSENAMVTKEKEDKWRITDRKKIYIVKKEKGKLNIYNPTTFVGDADFISARIGSNAEFTGAEFEQLASFNRAQIEGSAFFNPATFVGDADFISARIGSAAVFTGAVFTRRASFNRVQIKESAHFNPAIFEDEANFVSARIGSNAVFTRAKFKQQAYFNSAQIKRESHFEGTIFDNDISFQDTSFKTVFFGEPNVQIIKNIDLRGCIYDRFQPISFWEQLMVHLDPYDRRPFTQLEETFRRAGKDKLADDVYYKRKCREYTENIAIRMYLFSWDCVPGDDDEKLRKFLKDDLDIGWTENAEIRKSNDGKTISISKDEKRSEIILDSIKKKATLKISDGRTFYLNVKKKQGKLNIYRKPIAWDAWLHSALRKHGSWRALLYSALRKLSALLLDRFLFWFTGYGVRLYRLLLAIVPILIIGTYIFHFEGAVKLDIQLPCMMSSQVTLPWWEAFWVSLNTFLPIEIPSGADWKPSSQIIPMLGIKFTTFATFLDLAGWILVPVGVAGIAGLLKRSK